MARTREQMIEAGRRLRRAWRALGVPAPPPGVTVPLAVGGTPVVTAGPAGPPATFTPNPPYSATPDNRPAILDCGLLTLTRDGRTQMSFGERAALEGIVSQVHPRVALEIGTAEGGNLRRIAAHSGRLHSIDVDHGPVGDGLPGNVELHTGTSGDMLPALLARLADADEVLDLILVDGDHSYDGIKRDLEILLASACSARSVILVHDTMNAEVRAGVEAVAATEYPSVVYVELDFVPGYVYRRGVAANTAWGGLGLILTDVERCGAYAGAPRQDLYHEPFAALQRLRAELVRGS